MNASLITIKCQSQMIFTGYEKGIQAITHTPLNRPTIFNGLDELTVNNLKMVIPGQILLH